MSVFCESTRRVTQKEYCTCSIIRSYTIVTSSMKLQQKKGVFSDVPIDANRKECRLNYWYCVSDLNGIIGLHTN